MLNKPIYLLTLKKILNHKIILFVLLILGFLIPISLIINPRNPSVSAVETWDAFAISAMSALLIVTATNSIGSALTLGGRSDYMPLIVTRPLHRFQYVIAKWLALSTVIIAVSLLQHTLLTVGGAYSRWGLSNDMILAGFPERIVSALSVASVLTMIYSLPKQGLVLCGIIAFEVATGISIFSMSIAVPLPEQTSDVSWTIVTILGGDEWARTVLLPAIFGGRAFSSIQQYATILVNLANFLAPQVHIYDMFMARPFLWTPFLEVVSNILLSLTIASAILNAREYHYDSD
jgi:hypothetical protein